MSARRLSTCKCLAFCAVTAAGADAAAQTGVAVSERDYFEELPVVLSVSRLAQPLNEAPGAVTVIDRDLIRQSGARHIIDLLRLVPGFQVASIPNGSPAAVYHGLAEAYPRHMQVLLDGRSQYSPFFLGGVNWNLIPVSLDDIDHIEVVRGSNSAAYGANAVLGVVNIVTRHSQETRGAAAEVHAGTQGVNDKRIRVGAGTQDFSIRYTAEARFDTGFGSFRDNTGQRLNDVRADWRLGARDEVQMQVGEIVTGLQVGSGSVSDPRREQRLRQQYAQVGWRRTLSPSEELAVRYYRSEEGAADVFSFQFGPFTVPVDYGFRSTRNNLEATHTFSPWRETRLVWGTELRADAVKGAMFYGRPDDVSQTITRLFGNLEWRPTPAWIANFGATWEHDSNTKTTFAPRLAVNWHAMPTQTLRAAISRAYRTPSLFESRANYGFSSSTGLMLSRLFLAQGNVRPEAITSLELGWIGDFKPLRLTGDVRIFAERLNDRLVSIPTVLAAPNCEVLSPPCGEADAVYNAQSVRIRGLEYQLRWQPLDATRVLLNQSFIKMAAEMHVPGTGIAATYDPAKDATQAANSAPTHTTTLMLMQRLAGDFDLSAIYHSFGAMKWSNNTNVAHWQRLDWRLAYRFRTGPTRGELAFTVQSDGSPHAEHAASELLTPRSYVTLRLEY